MPTRRVIKSVLRNLLGTLTSRYSDWHGYWLLGFVVKDLEPIESMTLPHALGVSTQRLRRSLQVEASPSATHSHSQLAPMVVASSCGHQCVLRRSTVDTATYSRP